MQSVKSFDAKMARFFQVTGVKTDSGLARILDIQPPSISAARKRQMIPGEWIEKIAEHCGVSAHWLIFGDGEKYEGQPAMARSCCDGREVALEAEIAELRAALRSKDDTIEALALAIKSLHKQDKLELPTEVPQYDVPQQPQAATSAPSPEHNKK